MDARERSGPALRRGGVIVPVGAAFRAKDGELVGYPPVGRLLPDPRGRGWRTPLPPQCP